MKLKSFYLTQDEIPAEFSSLYEQVGDRFELTGIEGVKTQSDIDRLQAALAKERSDHKAVRQTLAKFGNRNVDEILSELDKIEEYKLASGKIDEAKVNELVEARIKSRIAPIERERANSSAKIKELEDLVSAYETKERTRSIHDSLRAAISKSQGFVSSAIDDALMYAERVFEVDERGQVITRDSVGVTPGIDPAVWLSEMAAKKPHWWQPSIGGGAKGGVAGVGGNNPWAKETFNLTEQAKILRDNPQRAEQLAKLAGVSVY